MTYFVITMAVLLGWFLMDVDLVLWIKRNNGIIGNGGIQVGDTFIAMNGFKGVLKGYIKLYKLRWGFN